MSKIITTFKMPHSLEIELLKKIVGDGYGMRGKSRWIVEALDAFFSLPDYTEMVNIADAMGRLDKAISVRLPEAIAKKIDQALIEVRKQHPDMEGVKSNIIRASIMQRMLRK